LGGKTDCNNYQGISLLSTTYNIVSNILLENLTPYVNEIIGDHQCEFCHNRSTTNQIFYIQKYNGTVHQPFIDVKKAYDSVKREVLYILLELGILKKPVRLIKKCFK